MNENLLRERVYHAAVHWFFNSTMWYNPNLRKELEEDIKTLIFFCRLMEVEGTSMNILVALMTALYQA